MCSLCYNKVMRVGAEKVLITQRITRLSATLLTLSRAMGMQATEEMEKKKKKRSSYRRCR